MATVASTAALLLASAAAGAINAVAGGGMLVTFPTLVSLGLSPIAANATSTVGLLTGTLASIGGYRREIQAARGAIARLVPPSLAGGFAGALLLLETPEPVFARLVPFLILGASALFLLQGRIRARESLDRERTAPGSSRMAQPPGRGARWGVPLIQLAIAVYGGYFGAAIGILMLAAFGLLRLGSIHRTNGLKTLSTACINGVAAAVFIARGVVDWPAVLTMIAGSAAGGYFGADGARRLGERTVRRIVVAIGIGSGIIMLFR